MNNDFIMKPKVDFCFKELMEEPMVRKGFIAAVLSINPEEIEETVLMPTILNQEFEDDKLGILDVRILLNGGIQINMEMQVTPLELWPERSMFYLSKMFASQIKKGNDYEVLGKCIHIGILDFELFPEDEEYYSSFHLWEDTRRRRYSDKMCLKILELAKIKKKDYPETELLRWMKFMNAERKEEFQMLAKDDEYMMTAYERLINLSADEMKRLEYEQREKAIMDHNWQIKCSRRAGLKAGLEKGLAEGRAKGLAEGRAKGLAEGRAKGLAEGRAKGLAEGRADMIQFVVASLRECGFSQEEAALRLTEKLSVEQAEAKGYITKYWK